MGDSPPSQWFEYYSEPEIWSNFKQLDFNKLTDNQIVEHTFLALNFAKQNSIDPIIPLHRIFSNLKNRKTMEKQGIRINYANVKIDDRYFEVLLHIILPNTMGSRTYPRKTTTILFGGVSTKLPNKPGWWRNFNHGIYVIGVKGEDDFNFLKEWLGL